MGFFKDAWDLQMQKIEFALHYWYVPILFVLIYATLQIGFISWLGGGKKKKK